MSFKRDRYRLLKSKSSLLPMERLEPRTLLSGVVPALSSDPGAFAKLYLDFNGAPSQQWGGYSVPGTPAYDIDGDPSTFNGQELSNINEIWQRVAEKFSPFNLDVTTVDSGNLNHRQTLQAVIGGSGSWVGGAEGGISYVGSFAGSSPNIVWIFPQQLNNGDPRIVSETTAHEAGHAFGLVHQSLFDANGNLVNQYNPGNNEEAPIMGISYSAQRGVWWKGADERGPSDIQNDAAIIAGAANGFGLRNDGHSHSLSNPDPLNLSGNSISAYGVINTINDQDVFSFTTTNGNVTINANPAPVGPMLDLKLSLYNSAGTLLSTADTVNLGESISMNLTAGAYEVVVASHGNFGDLGQYNISGTINPYFPPSAPPNLNASAVSPSQINLFWSDNSSNETGFEIDRSPDNSSWSQLTSVGANTTFFADTSVAPGTTYFYRVRAFDDLSVSAFTSSAQATTGIWPPSAPSNLNAAAISTSQINLTWSDNSTNETGFTIQRSTDDSNWTNLATVAPNDTACFDLNLPAASTFYYRVNAINSAGGSSFSNDASATTFTPAPIPPNAPSGVQATAASSTQINLAWIDSSDNEDGFYLERSTNGSTGWTRIAALQANQATYQDVGLIPALTYFYRVLAFSSAGVSTYSDPANATTLAPAAVPPAAPSSLVATTISPSEIDLAWTNNFSAATGFKIDQSSDGSSWSLIGTSSTPSFQVNGLAASNNYFFRVRAYDAHAESASSNVAGATTADVPAEGAPQPYTVTLDSSSSTGITGTGVWYRSTDVAGYYGADYLTDGNTGKGKILRFTPSLANAGTYELFLRWPAATNRAKNLTVDVTSAAGTYTVKVNQRINGGQWVSLGKFNFDPAKSPGMITLRTGGSNGFVVADAVQLVQQPTFDASLSKPRKSTRKNPAVFKNTLKIKPARLWAPGIKAPFADNLHYKTKAKPGTFSSSLITGLV